MEKKEQQASRQRAVVESEVLAKLKAVGGG